MSIKSISAKHDKGSVILEINLETFGIDETIKFIISENQAENLVQPLAFAAHDAREYLNAKTLIGEK